MCENCPLWRSSKVEVFFSFPIRPIRRNWEKHHHLSRKIVWWLYFIYVKSNPAVSVGLVCGLKIIPQIKYSMYYETFIITETESWDRRDSSHHSISHFSKWVRCHKWDINFFDSNKARLTLRADRLQQIRGLISTQTTRLTSWTRPKVPPGLVSNLVSKLLDDIIQTM